MKKFSPFFEQKMLPAIKEDNIKPLEDFYKIFTDNEEKFKACGLGAADYNNIIFAYSLLDPNFLKSTKKLNLSKLIRFLNFFITYDIDPGRPVKQMFK
jgi:hypothetical protein